MSPRGELIYLSERKLFNLALANGVSTAWLERNVGLQTAGKLGFGMDQAAGMSVSAHMDVQLIDARQRERGIENVLGRVTKCLEGAGLPELDEGALRIAEGDWFRFRRRLRFGVGIAGVRAIVFVDREAVEKDDVLPGLLMHGAPTHLRAPYDDESRFGGNRTGSETETLFRWAQAVDLALDSDIELDLNVAGDALDRGAERRGPRAPAAMYDLFARDDWMGEPRFPQLVNAQACEGIALASLITAGYERTIVMASPLYVRVGPATPVPDPREVDDLLRPGRLRGLFKRK